MFLFPTNEDIIYGYDPNSDPDLHRKNIMASSILVIFAYTFSLDGPESNIFEDTLTAYYPAKEDGYSYLKRMNSELVRGTDISIPSLHITDTITYRNRIMFFSERLPHIKNKNNIVGLLKLAYKSYRNSHWQIGYEYSNLFKNCIERCLGRKDPTCHNMYAGKII